MISDSSYQKNLDIAFDLFIKKEEIPEIVLLNLVPENYGEFKLFYDTTSPDYKIKNSGFFYHVTDLIFEKYTKKRDESFYLPSLKLASFADGEFGESFVDYLEKIIELDPEKFCIAVKDQEYIKYNPIRYFFENKCNK